MKSSFKLTTDVKKQHTVPRFLLDQFGFGKKQKKRKIFTFDKHTSRIFQQSVYDATTRNTFYNLDNHPEKVSLEPILNVFETSAAPIIKKIICERSLSWMSDNDKYKVATFIAVQRSRSYAELQRINDLINQLNNRLMDFGADSKQLESEMGGDNSQERKNFFLKMVLGQEDVISHLMSKSWILYETSIKDPFFISDNPVTLHNDIDMGLRGNLGIAVKGIQIHIPISSTLTLALTCPSIKESILEGKRMIEEFTVSAPHMLKNIRNPAEILELANAYENTGILKQFPENVRFLNSLQVQFSEQYLFCQNDSFNLVQEMLKSNKAYKHGLRSEVN